MQLCLLDLDGSVMAQERLRSRCPVAHFEARVWGPTLRLACAWRRFRAFEQALAEFVNKLDGARPALTLYGSGDFHHVSLALIRVQQQPVNLLVLDKHPDWMRGVPFLHCGTWLYHAARLPWVKRVFHVGGDLDFDNYYRWMAPWKMLHSGKIIVVPGVRTFGRGRWNHVPNQPLRSQADKAVETDRLHTLLEPYAAEIAARPLYISVDKDVMTAEDAVVNWDSGHLRLGEVRQVLKAFLGQAGCTLAGMDITGDWSPVAVRGSLRRFMHWTEHPALEIDARQAQQKNEAANLALIQEVGKLVGNSLQRACA
jgi:arginase family enzyme